ncbi:MAG: hypothetical protein RSD44_08695, partial [Akkermansia sp.]
FRREPDAPPAANATRSPPDPYLMLGGEFVREIEGRRKRVRREHDASPTANATRSPPDPYLMLGGD